LIYLFKTVSSARCCRWPHPPKRCLVFTLTFLSRLFSLVPFWYHCSRFMTSWAAGVGETTAAQLKSLFSKIVWCW